MVFTEHRTQQQIALACVVSAEVPKCNHPSLLVDSGLVLLPPSDETGQAGPVEKEKSSVI
jgi:hypothetical protein